MTPRTLTRRSRGRLVALTATGAAVLAAAPAALGQAPQTAPPGVNCAYGDPQYGYGPSYGNGGVPSYGVGTGAATGTGNPGGVKLTRGQLLINQRISQAAIRRTEAIQKWLDAGIVPGDICGGALGSEDFGGVETRPDRPFATPPRPKPRSLAIRAVGGGDPGGVTLSKEQLLINQRISQAAVRRANALRARLLAGLTGGDVKDGSLTLGQVRVGTRIIAATPVATPPPASVTTIAGGPSGNPGAVTLSRKQILINQRISQAAVRRANAIIAHLRTGLNGNDFKDGTLTAVDLAPGSVTP
ncbi:MAG: hypothetical protein U0237_17540 [Thermoleophilia bacterium]